MQENQTYLRTSEVASMFQVKVNTVLNWHASGKLRATIVTPGGHLRFDRDLVAKMLGGEYEKKDTK